MLFDFSDAVLSDCKRYRYVLTRQWNQHLATVVFIMLNPSIADARINDPTIRRCINFAHSWGYGGIRVVNLFAWRATNPTELRSIDDPVGPDNDKFIVNALLDSPITVVAWGATVHASRVLNLIALIQATGVTPFCLGFTKAGHPRHPLYVPKTVKLTPYKFMSYNQENSNIIDG